VPPCWESYGGQRINLSNRLDESQQRIPVRMLKTDPGLENEILEIKYLQRETPRIKGLN
jgi:hypothetical protein